MNLPITTENPLFGLILYPTAEEIRIKQQDVLWTAEEIPVEKDIHDFRNNMDKYQFRAASITLDLFVEIEQTVGNIWGQIASWFPHSEIDGVATQIAAVEKAVHAPFYQKMSDKMNIDPEETAEHQQTIAVLRKKLELIANITANLSDNKLLSTATVTLIEQVLLFSNFAMLKSFKANGHNLIANTLVGVDFVVQDETLHGIFATFLHNTIIEESTGIPDGHLDAVHAIVNEIILHEDAVIDYVFDDQASINDITPAQLKIFIRSRANEALTSLRLPTLYEEPEVNVIADWFYKSASGIRIHDFFSSGTSQYRRGWITENLSRLPFLKEANNV